MQWLAILARNGLLRGGFAPPGQFREYRLIARQMQKLNGMLSAEKNRLYKVLADAGIRLVVVSDIQGKSGKSMIKSLQTLPGDDMKAFGTPAKLASWADVCPGNNESAGKKKSGKTRKGNPYVRRILCEAANAACTINLRGS